MLTLEQLHDFEETYTKNMDTVIMWEKQMIKQDNHDAWMQTVYLRSQAMRHIYMENQTQMDALFTAMREPLEDDVREALFAMLVRLFYADNYEDAVMMLTICDTLLPYYEEMNQHLYIIRLLSIKSFLMAEYYYRQTRYPDTYSYAAVHGKLHEYCAMYKELPAQQRCLLLVNIYNMTCSLPMVLPQECNHALDIYDEFCATLETDEIMRLDREEENAMYRRKTIHDGIWNIAEIVECFDKEHLLHFYDLVKEEYKKQSEQNEQANANVLSAYYYVSAYIHEKGYVSTDIDWLKAYTFLMNLATKLLISLEKLQIQSVDDDFLMQFYYPYQEAANYVFRVYRYIKGQFDETEMLDFIRRGTKILYRIPKDGYIWLMYAIHAEWCENALGAIDDPEEQMELINRIIVKGQIQTYIHSQMVGLLADAILKYIIEDVPHLLLTLPNLTSIQDVRKRGQDIREFVNRAALYHDIGKSKISSIINLQTRSLVKEEFDLIKEHPQHPQLGALKNNAGFAKYYDIIEGHHKSYDGKSGYPAYFDNVHSPYRILIDIITICDCLDAATDRLGRNYTKGKDIYKAIAELGKGKGTKYNPDIVQLIENNDVLQKELAQIVEKGRDEVYYQTYKEYFS